MPSVQKLKHSPHIVMCSYAVIKNGHTDFKQNFQCHSPVALIRHGIFLLLPYHEGICVVFNVPMSPLSTHM